MNRFIEVFGLVLMLVFIVVGKINAQVVINEVSPASNPEWVEIYNTGSSEISLKEYSINFGIDSQTLYFCDSEQISGNAYKLIYLEYSWLSNSGDVVSFRNGDDEIDLIGYGTGYTLSKPSSTSSITRNPDGSSSWSLNTITTPQGDIVSFNCPTTTPSTTPTPETRSVKAVYNINTPKDGNGTNLNGVQIYVDGNYIHHEDDEALEFFNGHECYSGVECSLGIHTVSLRKSGYISWEDTRDFVSGINLEVNPILEITKTTTPTPTVSPTMTPKPSPIRTATVSANLMSSESGIINIPDVLGTENSSNEDRENTRRFNAKIILPILIIILGICFITFAISSIIRNAKRKDLENN